MRLIKTKKITKKHRAWIFQLGTYFSKYPIYVHFNTRRLNDTTLFNTTYSYMMEGVKSGDHPLQGFPDIFECLHETYVYLRRSFHPKAPYFYRHWK